MSHKITNAQTPVTVRTEGGFDRTALVVDGGDSDTVGSFDLVSTDGVHLARVNAFVYRAQGKVTRVIVDVIDSSNTFASHTAVCFKAGARQFTETGSIVSADFAKKGGRP